MANGADFLEDVLRPACVEGLVLNGRLDTHKVNSPGAMDGRV